MTRLDQDLKMFTESEERRPWIYVSGPMRGAPGDVGPWLNCRIGMDVGKKLWVAGWHPFVPMLNAFWEMSVGALTPGHSDGASGWLEFDFSAITRCDALLRLPGKSDGADREVAVALAAGIPVFYMETPDGDVPGVEVMVRADLPTVMG